MNDIHDTYFTPGNASSHGDPGVRVSWVTSGLGERYELTDEQRAHYERTTGWAWSRDVTGARYDAHRAQRESELKFRAYVQHANTAPIWPRVARWSMVSTTAGFILTYLASLIL